MTEFNLSVRLQPSLLEELRRAAQEDEATLDQYVNLAVAEKLAARRMARAFFAEKAQGADVDEALRILGKAGREPPRAGDELPPLEDGRAAQGKGSI